MGAVERIDAAWLRAVTANQAAQLRLDSGYTGHGSLRRNAVEMGPLILDVDVTYLWTEWAVSVYGHSSVTDADADAYEAAAAAAVTGLALVSG